MRVKNPSFANEDRLAPGRPEAGGDAGGPDQQGGDARKDRVPSERIEYRKGKEGRSEGKAVVPMPAVVSLLISDGLQPPPSNHIVQDRPEPAVSRPRSRRVDERPLKMQGS